MLISYAYKMRMLTVFIKNLVKNTKNVKNSQINQGTLFHFVQTKKTFSVPLILFVKE